MHVVIGGYGRVGRYIAQMLESEGPSVAVIDHDADSFEGIEDAAKGRKLAGEVFDRETLEKAGIRQAEAFCAVTSGDNSNILSARIARARASDTWPPSGRFRMPCSMTSCRSAGLPSSSKAKLANCSVRVGS